jgi:hypothetical protein
VAPYAAGALLVAALGVGVVVVLLRRRQRRRRPAG